MSKQSKYFLLPNENLKTSQIWKEAGFCPPLPFMRLIETLHKSEECEVPLTKPFDEAIFHGLFDLSHYDKEEYQIYDTTRLKAMAMDCGISVEKQETTFIAQKLTRVFLQDYGIYLTKNSRDTDIQ